MEIVKVSDIIDAKWRWLWLPINTAWVQSRIVMKSKVCTRGRVHYRMGAYHMYRNPRSGTSYSTWMTEPVGEVNSWRPWLHRSCEPGRLSAPGNVQQCMAWHDQAQVQLSIWSVEWHCLRKHRWAGLYSDLSPRAQDRFSFMKATLLVVRPGHCKKGMYTPTNQLGMDTMSNLPILELETGETGKKWLITAGGQHSVNAVKEWVKKLHKQYSKLVKQRDLLEKQDSKMATSVNIKRENLMQKPKRDTWKAMLALGAQ